MPQYELKEIPPEIIGTYEAPPKRSVSSEIQPETEQKPQTETKPIITELGKLEQRLTQLEKGSKKSERVVERIIERIPEKSFIDATSKDSEITELKKALKLKDKEVKELLKEVKEALEDGE